MKLSKRIKNKIKIFINRATMFLEFYQDYKNYKRWNYNNPAVKTRAAQESKMLRQTHMIEKGMSLSAPRKGFGQQKIKELFEMMNQYLKLGYLPELISLFKESADVQTADMLNLPVPEAEYINEVLKPSETQQEMVSSFADRAEQVRNGNVNPKIDNMLKITNDGRKLALDQRLINDLLPDEPESKVNLCVENAYQVWEESTPDKSTQLIFCDLSTPKTDGTFNVYDDVREKLVAKGIPREEIAFIHEANTETKKAELFAKVRSGQVRILLGSTPKLGAGTNIQDRLIALHHLDCPWKPSDLEQQEGRILRQGNRNQKVKIFRYVTENTFDSYMWVRHEVA